MILNFLDMNYIELSIGFEILPFLPLKYDEIESPFIHYLVVDEAFPLLEYLMRSYTTKKTWII